jgi:hypothetical protein
MASNRPPEERVPELLASLTQAIALLNDARELHWAEWLEKDRKLIEAEDFYGIEHLLSAFGGMGSFSDVAVQPSAKNAELKWARERIYEIAYSLRRERHRREAI